MLTNLTFPLLMLLNGRFDSLPMLGKLTLALLFLERTSLRFSCRSYMFLIKDYQDIAKYRGN